MYVMNCSLLGDSFSNTRRLLSIYYLGSTISKRMSKRSRLSCFKKWQKMTGLYSPSDQHKVSAENLAGAVLASAVDNIVPAVVPAGLPESARNAPTAGAAAAAAAAAAARLEAPQDVDFYLLSDIVNSGAARDSEVDWNSFRNDIEDSHGRWDELLQEWQEEVNPEDDVLELPLCEIARLLLERKQQAKMAAETVEAVDLPTLKQV
jgi:hypothetical protein